ncbi:MAG: transcriptional regulator [Candidatus Rokubacteria bacterium]|nr:transcriptional regulator [Candidatus Rokubacteria bacterium]MBI3826171.1 transcriptional regulator [Candidatus Rokubacteria bacterium]
MRLLSLVLWAIAVAATLAPVLGRRRGAAPRRVLPRDELVKDPVCQTYVVQSRAIRRTMDGEPRYFCSLACAERFAARS